MATPTYDLLESVTLATAASGVTFSSIDQSYGDLILTCNNPAVSNLGLELRINGDTGSNYNLVRMIGNGSGASSDSSSNANKWDYLYSSRFTKDSTFSLSLMDYSATDKHKSMLYKLGTASSQIIAGALRWASTSAINEINLLAYDSNNFPIGFTANLYGVAK